jgi:hypothetical protein
MEQLDGDLLVILLVGTAAQVDRAHPTAPQSCLDAIGADQAADHRIRFGVLFSVWMVPGQHEGRRLLEEARTHVVIGGEELLHCAPDPLVGPATSGDESLTLAWLQLEGLIDQQRDPFSPLGRHEGLLSSW